MSHNNKNNNQNNQATVDVKPEELKPVNNEKPEKVKITFKERVFGWPKRHPKLAKAGKVVLETVWSSCRRRRVLRMHLGSQGYEDYELG